jgi:flagellar secretion chaperone FliS
MKNPAVMYRESAVRGASPVGLIVILYEEVIRSLRKAQKALKQKQVEQRSNELTHVIEIIGYLQSILDFEKGGRVARDLSIFYTAMRTQVFQANTKASDALIESIAENFVRMKSQWQQVEKIVGNGSAEKTADLGVAAVRLAPVGAEG